MLAYLTYKQTNKHVDESPLCSGWGWPPEALTSIVRHVILWAFQSPRWQSREQYVTSWHWPHLLIWRPFRPHFWMRKENFFFFFSTAHFTRCIGTFILILCRLPFFTFPIDKTKWDGSRWRTKSKIRLDWYFCTYFCHHSSLTKLGFKSSIKSNGLQFRRKILILGSWFLLLFCFHLFQLLDKNMILRSYSSFKVTLDNWPLWGKGWMVLYYLIVLLPCLTV